LFSRVSGASGSEVQVKFLFEFPAPSCFFEKKLQFDILNADVGHPISMPIVWKFESFLWKIAFYR